MPIPSKKVDGVYNSFSGIFWCRTETACIHEIGHKLDHEGGWISRTHDFALALEAFLWHEIAEHDAPHPFVYPIMTFDGLFEWDGWFVNHQAELYASLFQWSKGSSENMPELLRQFYDWERAEELIEKYVR